jgi:hypothetical protein
MDRINLIRMHDSTWESALWDTGMESNMKAKRFGVAGVALGALLAVGFASSANANGSVTFGGGGSCSSYSYYGYSTFSNTYSRQDSMTLALGLGCKTVGAAVRFYTNPGPWSYGYASVHAYYPGFAYGGFHQGGGNQRTT